MTCHLHQQATVARGLGEADTVTATDPGVGWGVVDLVSPCHPLFGGLQMSIFRLSAYMALSSGASVTAAVLAMGIAQADGDSGSINGWAVTPTSDSPGLLGDNATLSDPGDTLGLGTSPIAGDWISSPATLSSIGSNDQFSTPDTFGSSDYLYIFDRWLPGLAESTVQVGNQSALAFLVPTLEGNRVVDLVNFESSEAPPLFNPDATGPIEVGGVELASPQSGALLNDLFAAIFQGDTAGWSNATTVFDDWLGIEPSGIASATDVLDLTGLVPDLGF
jgi:hypothetical protein